MGISNSDSDYISFFLETVYIFICDFILDFVNDADYIDYFELVLICDVDALRRLMVEMKPVSGHERNVRFLRDFFDGVLPVLELEVVDEPGSIQTCVLNALDGVNLVLNQMLLLPEGIFTYQTDPDQVAGQIYESQVKHCNGSSFFGLSHSRFYSGQSSNKYALFIALYLLEI